MKLRRCGDQTTVVPRLSSSSVSMMPRTGPYSSGQLARGSSGCSEIGRSTRAAHLVPSWLFFAPRWRSRAGCGASSWCAQTRCLPTRAPAAQALRARCRSRAPGCVCRSVMRILEESFAVEVDGLLLEPASLPWPEVFNDAELDRGRNLETVVLRVYGANRDSILIEWRADLDDLAVLRAAHLFSEEPALVAESATPSLADFCSGAAPALRCRSGGSPRIGAGAQGDRQRSTRVRVGPRPACELARAMEASRRCRARGGSLKSPRRSRAFRRDRNGTRCRAHSVLSA